MAAGVGLHIGLHDLLTGFQIAKRSRELLPAWRLAKLNALGFSGLPTGRMRAIAWSKDRANHSFSGIPITR